MVPVEQTSFYRPDDHPLGPSRGNCLAACVASIFEIPITQATDGWEYGLDRWTKDHYPALDLEHRILKDWKSDLDFDSWKTWPKVGEVFNRGYWIAVVYSHRVPDVMLTGCACADRIPGGDPECEWCHGKPDDRKLGIQWGLHAVVMNGRDLVWDPHPRRADGIGPICGQHRWFVYDPAKL